MGTVAGKKDLRVLLISDSESSISEINKHIMASDQFSPRIWHSSGLSESIDILKQVSPEIDVVLVDLHLVSSGRPREAFQKLENIVGGVPIIVFNGTIEHDLALFLIEEGAADNVTKDQADADPHRLSRAIEHSMARHRIFQTYRKKSAQEISDIRKQWQTEIRAANGKITSALKKSEESSAEIIEEIIKEKDQIISWMSGGYSM